MTTDIEQRKVAQALYIAQIWPRIACASYKAFKEGGRGCAIIDATYTVRDETGANVGHEIAYVPVYDRDTFREYVETLSPNMRSECARVRERRAVQTNFKTRRLTYLTQNKSSGIVVLLLPPIFGSVVCTESSGSFPRLARLTRKRRRHRNDKPFFICKRPAMPSGHNVNQLRDAKSGA